jgi:site-specific DNA-methyltransferase (adenine-specific)
MNFKEWFNNKYFETNKGIIIQDDCFNQFKNIPSKSIDLILVDLPYGSTACSWDFILPMDKLWEEYERIIKDNGIIVLFGAEPFSSLVRTSNLKLYKYDWVWDKKIPSGMSYARFQPMRQHENIMVFYKNRGTYNPQMTKRDKPIKEGGKKKSESAPIANFDYMGGKVYEYKNPTTILTFDKVRKGSLHSTQKPTELLEYLIKTYTNEGDLVLDNTAGVCSTGVACENTNRNWICVEKDYDDKGNCLGYCEKAKNRFGE